MLDPQNFSVYSGDDFDVYIDIDPDDGITLVGATIVWRAYEQELGLPKPDLDPVIEKSNREGGTVTVDDPETQTIKIPLVPGDTSGLLRNYWHECVVVDPDRGDITVAQGIMTVLQKKSTDVTAEEATT